MSTNDPARPLTPSDGGFDARRIRLRDPRPAAGFTVLSPEALAFVGELEERFGPRRRRLLARRRLVQARLDAGRLPDFDPRTRAVREGDWRVAPVPAEIADRRVEITGPVDRRMVVNALNSGACVYMADFEDSTSPTFENLVAGQHNLRDALRGEIDFVHAESGKRYVLRADPAVLFVRPRGLHLPEVHVLLDDEPVSGAFFDFGLYAFHNARALLDGGRGVYFYLPKLQSRREARLWNDVLVFAQERLGIPRGTFKATVLVEHVLTAFEMDEVLYELREHSAGLNCGRWDYIFSFIKSFRAHPGFLVGDRGVVGMDRRFLDAYSRLLVATCHRRGAFAMGGMAAQIPIKDDAERNAAALAKVRADKRREATSGYDGTWVAHPALIATAREEFDAVLRGPNQLERVPDASDVEQRDLLCVPVGVVTEAGLRQNLRVAVAYVGAWLDGNGCVPIDHLMEDAATAEISRTQVWQWLHHGAHLADGRRVERDLVQRLLDEELARLLSEPAGAPPERLREAARLVLALVTDDELAEFLTLHAYPNLD